MIRGNFIERSLTGALSFLEQSVFSDDYAMRRGLLQKIDPRIKLVSFVMFLVICILIKNIPLLIFLYFFSLLLAQLSRINLFFFLKRTWIFIPLFAVFIAIPAFFSVFSPGEALFSFKALGMNFIITHQGFWGAALFILRVSTSVSIVVLLSLTTKQVDLLRALRVFGVPQIFVMTLGMCYRYLYLFIGIIENTYLAIKSRVGFAAHYKKGQQVVAWNIATLWQRSLQLNNEVYQAMLSRGYSGEPAVLREYKALPRDWLWLISSAVIFTTLFYLNGRINF